MNSQLVSICVKFIGFRRKTVSRQPPRFNESQNRLRFSSAAAREGISWGPCTLTHTYTHRKQAPFGVYVNMQKQNG